MYGEYEDCNAIGDHADKGDKPPAGIRVIVSIALGHILGQPGNVGAIFGLLGIHASLKCRNPDRQFVIVPTGLGDGTQNRPHSRQTKDLVANW